MWNPQNPSVGDKVARAIVYFVALIYMFLGMSIIADRFMSSIEVCKPFVGIKMEESKTNRCGMKAQWVRGHCRFHSQIHPFYHQRAAEIPQPDFLGLRLHPS